MPIWTEVSQQGGRSYEGGATIYIYAWKMSEKKKEYVWICSNIWLRLMFSVQALGLNPSCDRIYVEEVR